jgi:hypothetical protein
MRKIHADKAREDELLTMLERSNNVLGVTVKRVGERANIIVNPVDVEEVMFELEDFTLNPHNHTAKRLIMVSVLSED